MNKKISVGLLLLLVLCSTINILVSQEPRIYYIGYDADDYITVINKATGITELWNISVNDAWNHVTENFTGPVSLEWGPGQFNVSDDLYHDQFPSFIMYGQGMNLTTFKAVAQCRVFFFRNGANLQVSDLAINGDKNNLNQTTEDTYNPVYGPYMWGDKDTLAIMVDQVQGFTLERLHIFDNLMHQVYVRGKSTGVIQDSIIEGAGRTGPGVTYSGQGNILVVGSKVTITRNILRNALSKQIYLGWRSYDNHITDNDISGGVGIMADGNKQYGHIIENNRINAGIGAYITSYPDSLFYDPIFNYTFRNNTINSSRTAILYDGYGQHGGRIIDNQIQSLRTGIELRNVHDETLTDNNISAGDGYNAIISKGVSDYLTVINNILNQPLSLVGTHNIVYNNTGDEPEPQITIQGYVVNGDGAPVEGALVQFGPFETTTNQTGYYTITLPAATYEPVVQLPENLYDEDKELNLTITP